VAELWDRWLRGRRAGAAMVVERDLVTRALRPELTVATAGDILWTLNDTDLYMSLTVTQGWDERVYRTWLAQTMTGLLLRPPRRRAGRTGDADRAVL
jgi:hypothetical protein